jgi:maltooligosyltrehalose trehalohydrolase
VQIGDATYPMIAAADGWWHRDVQDAGHGTGYRFLLDGDPKAYPDPRSPWQPDGVHGPSRVLDHARFQWSDSEWLPAPLSRAILYEIHVGTFTPEGTFAAIIGRLAALKELGITHLELMPVNSFPGRWGWGYDGAALFAPQEQYGGPEGLKQLVDACHAHGLGVLLDVVYNHFGPVGNYTGRFAPYVTRTRRTPWGVAVNLDKEGSVEVRRFFIDNALMWLRDYHFDGLRLDAVSAFVDRTPRHFLAQLSEEVESLSQGLGKDFVLIAESDWNDSRVVTPRKPGTEEPWEDFGGYGIDAQWSDDFHHAIFALLSGERNSYYRDFGSIAKIAKALKSVFVFDGQYSTYRGAIRGKPVKNLSAHRFLGYIQNHDQVGNRGHGDRIHKAAGIRNAMIAAALVLTAPFVPMLFQGEEFAASSPFLYFADFDDPNLMRAISVGRRREHAPDGEWDLIPDRDPVDCFQASKLNWDEPDQSPHAEMLEWYRRLIHLRTSNEDLLDGRLENIDVRFSESEGRLAMTRGSLQMVFNFAAVPLSIAAPSGSQIVLSSDDTTELDSGKLVLPPEAVAILRLATSADLAG